MVSMMGIVFPILYNFNLSRAIFNKVILILLLLYGRILSTHHLWFLYTLNFWLKSSGLWAVTFLTHRSSATFGSIKWPIICRWIIIIKGVASLKMNCGWGSCGWIHRFCFIFWFIIISNTVLWIYSWIISHTNRFIIFWFTLNTYLWMIYFSLL